MEQYVKQVRRPYLLNIVFLCSVSKTFITFEPRRWSRIGIIGVQLYMYVEFRKKMEFLSSTAILEWYFYESLFCMYSGYVLPNDISNNDKN